MDTNSQDFLIRSISGIALCKSMLPMSLRGWVNALGLHVQERRAGRLTRLQAGSSLRSYFDAWYEADGDWELRRFDEATWDRRFAHLVEPTCNIADYLVAHAVPHSGHLGQKEETILTQAVQHFKSTQEWRWLPNVPVVLELVSIQMSQQDSTQLARVISHAESLRLNSKEPCDWQFLAMLYDLAARYKDTERTLENAYDLVRAGFAGDEHMVWRWRKTLGMLCFAAFSNSTRTQDIVILGSMPSRFTADSLGYTTDQVRALAEERLEATYADLKRSGSEDAEEGSQVEEAIATCKGVIDQKRISDGASKGPQGVSSLRLGSFPYRKGEAPQTINLCL